MNNLLYNQLLKIYNQQINWHANEPIYLQKPLKFFWQPTYTNDNPKKIFSIRKNPYINYKTFTRQFKIWNKLFLSIFSTNSKIVFINTDPDFLYWSGWLELDKFFDLNTISYYYYTDPWIPGTLTNSFFQWEKPDCIILLSCRKEERYTIMNEIDILDILYFDLINQRSNLNFFNTKESKRTLIWEKFFFFKLLNVWIDLNRYQNIFIDNTSIKIGDLVLKDSLKNEITEYLMAYFRKTRINRCITNKNLNN